MSQRNLPIEAAARPPAFETDASNEQQAQDQPTASGMQPTTQPAKRRQVRRGPVFGDIPGIPLFKRWDTREECKADGVHTNANAGICGTKKDGACSVALSGRYMDDDDQGNVISYSGSGGKGKGTRSGPQVEDQSFNNWRNMAMKVSSETGKPVRVIRGSNPLSKWAPGDGYRYDGLYNVETAELVRGAKGFMICQFCLRRRSGQLPIPQKEAVAPIDPRRRRGRNVDHNPVPVGPSRAAGQVATGTSERDSNAAQERLQTTSGVPSIGHEGSHVSTAVDQPVSHDEHVPSGSIRASHASDGVPSDAGIPSVNREATPGEQAAFLDHYYREDEGDEEEDDEYEEEDDEEPPQSEADDGEEEAAFNENKHAAEPVSASGTMTSGNFEASVSMLLKVEQSLEDSVALNAMKPTSSSSYMPMATAKAGTHPPSSSLDAPAGNIRKRAQSEEFESQLTMGRPVLAHEAHSDDCIDNRSGIVSRD
ncbi:hypothetical protein OBBRIDRAFT_657142 [Obba rivulosa]|uniref:YDG domain-containing protein n=1 Tax=Obba rivulosa TaxID=1052685 RepID=A0A8E2DIR6_9APHY|nr:hypothetical protein OBBRIDRAFT_657142 [Obba rivulosa]